MVSERPGRAAGEGEAGAARWALGWAAHRDGADGLGEEESRPDAAGLGHPEAQEARPDRVDAHAADEREAVEPGRRGSAGVGRHGREEGPSGPGKGMPIQEGPRGHPWGREGGPWDARLPTPPAEDDVAHGGDAERHEEVAGVRVEERGEVHEVERLVRRRQILVPDVLGVRLRVARARGPSGTAGSGEGNKGRRRRAGESRELGRWACGRTSTGSDP